MTAQEIKTAVDAGKVVHWSHKGYRVIKDKIGQYLIQCDMNKHCIGLTWQDGETLNGKPEQFFIEPSAITTEQIQVGAKFRTSSGIVWIIDLIKEGAVYTSMEKGAKGNYCDELPEVVKFLNEEKAERIHEPVKTNVDTTHTGTGY